MEDNVVCIWRWCSDYLLKETERSWDCFRQFFLDHILSTHKPNLDKNKGLVWINGYNFFYVIILLKIKRVKPWDSNKTPCVQIKRNISKITLTRILSICADIFFYLYIVLILILIFIIFLKYIIYNLMLYNV